MKIDECTVYKIGGRVFDSEEKAKQYEFDVIGEFISTKIINRLCYSPGDQIKIVEAIVANRDELLKLLDC